MLRIQTRIKEIKKKRRKKGEIKVGAGNEYIYRYF